MKRALLLAAWIASSAVLSPLPSYAQNKERSADAVVAKVNAEQITMSELETALARAARQSFYHGQASAERVAELRKTVLDDMITDRLLLAEAKKRGIGPDEEAVQKRIAEFEQQYKDSPQWSQMREQVLPELRTKMRENTIRARLEEKVRDVAAPTPAQLKTFYNENIPSFTEPERTRVSVILLKVDPGAPRATWDSAKQEGERIRGRLLKGESFAEMAKMHSAESSAGQDGDLGYLHKGMLAEEAEEAIKKLAVGEVTEPVQLLQGYALFKLTERSPARVRSLEDVKDRAQELYQRNTSEKQWTQLKDKLRRAAKIWIDEPLKLKAAAAKE